MAIPDPAEAEHALALCIVVQRDLMRDDLETVAARHGWAPRRLLEALAWWQRAEPYYRGSAILDRAEAAATRMRRKRLPLMAAGDRRRNVYLPIPDNEIVHDDQPDPDRPERPCNACGRTFQPTLRRRLLCAGCYRDDGNSAANSILTGRERAAIAEHGTAAPRQAWINHGDGAKPSRTR